MTGQRPGGAPGDRKSVMVILGTRPEVIKLAPVIAALREYPVLETVTCATAQHRELLDVALSVFGVAPEIDLDLMQPDQRVSDLMARAIESLSHVVRETRPDLVLVQGDTTTALAAALAAFYEGVPVGHVEAGLRTGDMSRPFPEEMNRRVIGTLATLHFAPTQRAREALMREHVDDESIVVSGNTVVDALQAIARTLPPARPAGRQILVTAHRRESFGPPFEDICTGLRTVALDNPDVEIFYPMHPNPNVREPVLRRLSGLPNVTLSGPSGYRDFVQSLRDAYLVLTDSGGVQEEAPTFGKPVLVMREVTERVEAVEAGVARLVGTDPGEIARQCNRLLNDRDAYEAMVARHNPYGDGHAGERIADTVARFLASEQAVTEASR